MEKIEYNGEVYRRTQSKWVDSRNFNVHESLQRTLNSLYLETLDYSAYTVEELVKEGDKFKDTSSYQYAIAFYERASIECDMDTLCYILPRITSCYRMCKMPRKVIDLFADLKSKYGSEFITPVLLTSIAAAYCDLGEYENALRCCRWAYRSFGEFNAPLSNVWARIKKESGLE